MSLKDEDSIFYHNFSTAGINSAKKYNILEGAKKIKHLKKTNTVDYFYMPDKDWDDSSDEDGFKQFRKEKKSNINIKNHENEIYMNGYLNNNNRAIIELLNKQKKAKNKLILKNKNLFGTENKKNPSKKLYSDLKKYKYHNIHMQKILKYKKDGIYQKFNLSQEPIYNPNLNYIYKRVITGPKWDKISSRDYLLFKKEKPKSNEKEKFKKNILNNTINSNQNNTQRSLENTSNKNTNNNMPLIKENYKTIDSKSFPLNSHKRKKRPKSIISFSKNQFIHKEKIKNNNIFPRATSALYINNNKLKKINLIKNDRKKLLSAPCNYSGIDFNKYSGRTIIKRRGKQIEIAPQILHPNYDSIQPKIKNMVKYNNEPEHKKKNKNSEIKNKHPKFTGINSSELFDVTQIYEKIYGNKLRAVPKFYKMASRPSSINLPSYMKGVYNRISLYSGSEKTLKMNNYANSQMYKFHGIFTPKSSKRQKVLVNSFDDEDENKVQRELNKASRKFNHLYYQFKKIADFDKNHNYNINH